jgi:outer membrane protein assembly factor BamA
VYYRQDISLRYEWKSGRHVITDRLIGGALVGQAPLFERFVLGNSSTLLGWNRYQIDPLGGDHMVHNSVSFGYQVQKGTAEVFYNAGLIGDGDKMGTVRHSLGLGFRQGIFNVAMAFPVIEGHIAPVFIAGMNY